MVSEESLVVTAPAHVSVRGASRRLSLGCGQWLRVEAMLKDRLDGSVAARTGVERSSTCSLDACVAILLREPKEAEAGAKAPLWVMAFAQNHFAECASAGTDLLSPGQNARR